MLRVSWIWGTNLSQICSGQFTSTVANAERVWYFAALTAGSAAFPQWLCDSINCITAFLLWCNFWLLLSINCPAHAILGSIFLFWDIRKYLWIPQPCMHLISFSFLASKLHLFCTHRPQKCIACRYMTSQGIDLLGLSRLCLHSDRPKLQNKTFHRPLPCIFVLLGSYRRLGVLHPVCPASGNVWSGPLALCVPYGPSQLL